MIRSYESNPSHHHLNQSFFQNCHFRLISSFFFISKLLKIVKINKKTQAVWMLVKSCLSPGFHGLLKLSHCCGLQPRGELPPWCMKIFVAFKTDGGMVASQFALKCAIIPEKLSKWFMMISCVISHGFWRIWNSKRQPISTKSTRLTMAAWTDWWPGEIQKIRYETGKMSLLHSRESSISLCSLILTQI